MNFSGAHCVVIWLRKSKTCYMYVTEWKYAFMHGLSWTVILQSSHVINQDNTPSKCGYNNYITNRFVVASFTLCLYRGEKIAYNLWTPQKRYLATSTAIMPHVVESGGQRQSVIITQCRREDVVLRRGFLDTVFTVSGWSKRTARCRTDFIGKTFFFFFT